MDGCPDVVAPTASFSMPACLPSRLILCSGFIAYTLVGSRVGRILEVGTEGAGQRYCQCLRRCGALDRRGRHREGHVALEWAITRDDSRHVCSSCLFSKFLFGLLWKFECVSWRKSGWTEGAIIQACGLYFGCARAGCCGPVIRMSPAFPRLRKPVLRSTNSVLVGSDGTKACGFKVCIYV